MDEIRKDIIIIRNEGGYFGTDPCEVECDLISRQDVIDRIRGTGYADLIKENVIMILMGLPSAKLEIIRCKDCKHLQKGRSEESAKKFGQIYECVRNVLDCPKSEDFCSRAERRIV